MRLSIISHTYVVPLNRQKIAALARNPHLEIEVIIPSHWVEESLRTTVKSESFSTEYSVRALPIFFAGNHSVYLYNPLSLYICLSKFRPHIVQIETEPHSLSFFQASCLKRWLGFHVIGFTWNNIFRQYPFPFSLIERFNFRSVDHIIAGNAEATEILVRKGVSSGVISHIPQIGVDGEFFRRQEGVASILQIPPSMFVVGFVGRLVEEKGIHLLLSAFPKLPSDVFLLVVGRGPLQQELQDTLITRFPQRNWRLVTTANHDDIPLYLSGMDVLVLPSITTSTWKEQFGHVIIEAMACQVPVIGSSSGEIARIIEELGGGVVFEEGNVSDLVAKIQMLKSDRDLCAVMWRIGREKALAGYSHARIAEKTWAVYKKVMPSFAC